MNKVSSKEFLSFEQPIAEMQAKIEELRLVGSDSEVNITDEIARLELKSKELTKAIFRSLSAWQIVQLARHPLRPHSLDYIAQIFTEFDELHGDRNFADDNALIAGLARLDGQSVMIIGQQKGRDTKAKISRNFGMVHPEGYRKALRMMNLADKYNIPVICFIDTPGAYPGIGAEARGQSEAIANNLFHIPRLKVPIIAIIIGEGCSGGALGIGVGDLVAMLEYSYFATISPEGCASILWKNAEKAEEASDIMGITADRLLALNIIDHKIAEPLGGAHRDLTKMAATLKSYLVSHLSRLKNLSTQDLLAQRYQRLTAIGR